MMVLSGQEGLECAVCVDVECCRKMVSGRKVAGAIRSLVNARGLQL